jgi:Co/Zn/Cd efflux system component
MAQKTTFRISKMDCPSEERLIRMKLEGITNIESLQFDIPNRILNVYHSGSDDQIYIALHSLKLDTLKISTSEVDDYIPKDDQPDERKLLWMVLAINFIFFILEIIMGFISHSMGLVADSLDMLADSFVYGLSLLAVGGTITRKKNIAKASGYFQMLLAFLGFTEVLRRFSGHSETPIFQTMIIISTLALTGNLICLYLLQKSKSEDAHIKASMIFTSNDVIVNIGVIIAAGLVYMTNSKIPDLMAGIIVFAIVGRGALRILQLSK